MSVTHSIGGGGSVTHPIGDVEFVKTETGQVHIEPHHARQPKDNGEKDPVSSPEHYTFSSIECIDAIEAALTREEFTGFLRGLIIATQDLAELERYAGRLKQHLAAGE